MLTSVHATLLEFSPKALTPLWSTLPDKLSLSLFLFLSISTYLGTGEGARALDAVRCGDDAREGDWFCEIFGDSGVASCSLALWRAWRGSERERERERARARERARESERATASERERERERKRGATHADHQRADGLGRPDLWPLVTSGHATVTRKPPGTCSRMQSPGGQSLTQ
jgi:hypothetical protein